MNDLTGTDLGQYHLIEVVRQGGMAIVYRATQATLDRDVAVKVLFSHPDPQFAARFKREARAIAQLQHPNILPIYDYGEQDGLLYLVVQYIEGGRTLRDLLGAPMEPVAALRLMEQVLQALDYAHSRGIIHRDIKPGNILLPSPTWPMLADFGIAKLMNESEGEALTLSGVFIGTPAYMAPEQAFSTGIDARTDLYAAGVVLYEMVTGRVPFDGNTPMTLLTKHAYEPPPPPRSINPNLPRIIEPILLRALAKDPTDRYQSASAMGAAIGQAIRMMEHGSMEDAVPAALVATTPPWGAAPPGYLAPPPATLPTAPEPATPGPTTIPPVAPPDPPPPVQALPPAAGRGLRPWMAAVALAAIVLVAGLVFGLQSLGAGPPKPPATSTPGTGAAATATMAGMVPAAADYGTLRFGDGARTLDQVTLTVTHLPLPAAGTHDEVWLLRPGDAGRKSIGILIPDATGAGDLIYRDPSSQNLLAQYDRLEITAEPDPDANPLPTGPVVFRGGLPAEALLHIGHLLVAYASTADQTALCVGLLQQATVLNQTATALVAAQQAGDLAAMRQAAEGMANIIGDDKGKESGDLDGDGTVTNPGDGYGLLQNGKDDGYIAGALDHAQFAGQAPSATANIKLHSAHVAVSAQNLGAWAVPLRALAAKIAASTAVATEAEDVTQAAAQAARFLNGQDADHNETVDPVLGEAGAITAYDHAIYMADIPILAAGGGSSAPTAAPQGIAYTPTAPAPPASIAPPTDTSVPPTQAAPPPTDTTLPPTAPPPTDTALPPTDTPPPPPPDTSTPTALLPPTATLPPVPAPAGTLVFTDDFSTGPGKSGLTDLPNDAFARGFQAPGVYQMALTQPGETRWELLPRLAVGDFSLQLDLWDASDAFTGNAGQGVVFRVRDNAHFYALLLNPRTGQYRVRKQDGAGQWSDLIAWKDAPSVQRQAAVNHLRLDAVGDSFTLYLNGAPLDQFQDATYPLGMVGLIAANETAAASRVRFDNLQIWSSDPPPTPPAQPTMLENDFGNLVLIPGATFILGGNAAPDAAAQLLTLPSFYLDHTEVVNAAYAQCLAQGKCTPSAAPASATHPDYATSSQFASFPVINVSWAQAGAFCAWAGKRLPTEAEWERAASWDAATRQKLVWPWGNTFDPARLNSAESQHGDVGRIGLFPPEVNGTLDLAGNVAEWTSSLFKSYPYNAADGREDPQAPGDRVVRGGSWNQPQAAAQGSARQPVAPATTSNAIGFRCAANP